jgi:hypothetical protein
MFVTLLFGFIGYVMDKYDFSKVTMVLGFILGRLAEISFSQGMMILGQHPAFFVTRPIALGLLIALVLLVVYMQIVVPLYKRRKLRAAGRPAASAAKKAGSEKHSIGPTWASTSRFSSWLGLPSWWRWLLLSPPRPALPSVRGAVHPAPHHPHPARIPLAPDRGCARRDQGQPALDLSLADDLKVSVGKARKDKINVRPSSFWALVHRRRNPFLRPRLPAGHGHLHVRLPECYAGHT